MFWALMCFCFLVFWFSMVPFFLASPPDFYFWGGFEVCIYRTFLPFELTIELYVGVTEFFIFIFSSTKFLLSLLLVDDIWISLGPCAVFVVKIVIASLSAYGLWISTALLTYIVILGFFKLLASELVITDSWFF